MSTGRARNTKEFVKELDDKEKSRRGYLDEIYKQAKLYNRKS